MPLITRLFLKSGVVYLILAIVGEVLANIPGGTLRSVALQFRPTVYHFFFIGWLTQMIFGVSHWFFPLYSKAEPRGKQWLIVTAFIGLNVGLVLRFFSEAPFWEQVFKIRNMLVLFSSLFLWIGFVAYGVHIWPRIKLKGHA